MKSRLAALPTEALQHLGLLIAFVLLLSASGFATTHPGLAAGLVFIFSCLYLVASVVSVRPHLLYPTMLLGAASYFLLCNAAGAPVTLFPLLSVPLVVALLLTGQHLRGRLQPELQRFPSAVFRAMHITVGVFTAWAVLHAPSLMKQQGIGPYVAALTFLGYAGLYAAHCTTTKLARFMYVFAGYLLAGGTLLMAVVFAPRLSWIAATAAGGAVLFVGTRQHRDRGQAWSRHAYYAATATLIVSVLFATSHWTFLLIDFALVALLLWVGYCWLADAVGDVRTATVAERAQAKWFFLTSLVLSLPLVPALLVAPGHASVAASAISFGLLFAWIGWERRDELIGPRNPYLVGAVLFASAGLLGIGRMLPGSAASAWSIAAAFGTVMLLGTFHSVFGRFSLMTAQSSMAEASVFPAFFAWYVPLLAGEPGVALVTAHAGMVVPLALCRWLRDRRFLLAFGPAAAGALISATQLLGVSSAAVWILCLAAAAAGGCMAWATAAGKSVIRGSACLAWTVLSVAAVVVAGGHGGVAVLLALTGVGVMSALLRGHLHGAAQLDLCDRLMAIVGGAAMVGVVAFGPFSGAGRIGSGGCVLLLSAACMASWVVGQRERHGRRAGLLFALGSLLIVFGVTPVIEIRLLGGALIAVALFAAAALAERRSAAASQAWTVMGHLTSIVVGAAALVQAWPIAGSGMAWAAVPFPLLYGLMPRLRERFGFRVGLLCWGTFILLFAATALVGTPYRHQAPLVAVMSLLWLAWGYS
ncbi:hypothetical protein HQ576_12300, partial [bacterium]|nr:hypothetical protein [bacterium]